MIMARFLVIGLTIGIPKDVLTCIIDGPIILSDIRLGLELRLGLGDG
jgi:hypothetical protein